MKSLAVFSLLWLIASVSSGSQLLDRELDAEWESFKEFHNKNYLSAAEDSRRRLLWQLNRQQIEEHNAQAELGLQSHRLAINSFADMTPDEILPNANRPVRESPRTTFGNSFASVTGLPKAVDWTKEGFVTPTTDQDIVASAIPFAVTGTIEGVLGIRNRRFVPLSAHQIEDCYHGESVQGAYESIMQLGGIMSKAAYGDSMENRTCHFDPKKTECSLITYATVNKAEKALQAAVANVGPIAVEVDASKFLFYEKGIFSDPKCGEKAPNHALLVTGYGSENGVDYWMLKNTWGGSWGEGGYIRIERNRNTCRIANNATYPVLA
ncbi:cathepsin L1 [Galendromus occidentalis]|uniref:Cathepsin L1 n=1 Tax=Galendromus occidentalis TaxID=34638 RepID=A0AAJ6VVJ0_9ACAR|nr:cathepsin L1 [Galendromus occidentalis]